MGKPGLHWIYVSLNRLLDRGAQLLKFDSAPLVSAITMDRDGVGRRDLLLVERLAILRKVARGPVQELIFHTPKML